LERLETEVDGAAIGRITTAGVITEYPVGSRPFGITNGPDGALWFTKDFDNKIGRITIAGGGLAGNLGMYAGLRDSADIR